MPDTAKSLVINATPLLGNLTGVGYVTAEISQRLDESDHYDTGFYTPLKQFDNLGDLSSADSSANLMRLVKKVFHYLPMKDLIRNFYGRLKVQSSLCDLYWEPNFIPLDVISARKVVTTVHDMSVFDHPEWHPADRVEYFSQNFMKNISRSDVVVTVSEFSRRGFIEMTGFPADKVHVIPCGLDHSLFHPIADDRVVEIRRKYSLPDTFILSVGTMEPRKNLDTLLGAFELMPQKRREACPLVLVGDTGWNNKSLQRRIEGMGQCVRRLGYLNEPGELALIYNAASLFIYPSHYEGFGMPPMEAMACGLPVCLSSIPALKEIYGPDSACFVDPLDTVALADAIIHLLDDSGARSRLTEAGLRLSGKYGWDKMYQSYDVLFRSLES